MVNEGELSALNDNSKGGETLSPQEHYFWIDRRFVPLLEDALSKKATLLYLLYARSCNPKHMQCSMVSYSSARKCLGLSHVAYDNARLELAVKSLIKLRRDIKTGYFKTTAIEVLDFPVAKDDSSTHSDNLRSMSLAKEGVILLPSILVDEGRLKGFSLLELRVLLFLYSICRWEECLGIDFQFVHKWHPKVPKGVTTIQTNFGSGFHPSIEGKPCFQVVQYKSWRLRNETLLEYGEGIYKVLNSLVEQGLLPFAPVVIWRDPEDSDIAEVRREVFQGLVGFKGESDDYKQKYRLAPLDKGESVIWVLRPVFPAQNTDYEAYEAKRYEQLEEATQLYKAQVLSR